ncbi:MAG: Uma2 family endonuclease [Isosphaerales bacterium]
MSTIAPTPPASAPAPLASSSVYRMTVDEYERLAAAGVLDDPRVELIDGLLVKKMTQKPPHTWAVEAAHDHLERILPPGWFIREEKPVRIPRFDEPEPDLSVIRGTRDDYRGRHPGPGDIALLVEVAESSHDRDQGEKRAAYAQGGIPLYWIVNLIDRQVEIYSDLGAGDYRSSQVLRPGQDILVVIDGVEVGRIAVTDVLP